MKKYSYTSYKIMSEIFVAIYRDSRGCQGDYHVKVFDALSKVESYIRRFILEERLTEHDLEELMELDNEVEMKGGSQFLTIVRSMVL